METIDTDIVLAVLRYVYYFGMPSDMPTVKKAIKRVEKAKAHGAKVLPVDAYELKKVIKYCDEKTFVFLYRELHHLNFLNKIRAEQ